MTAKLAHTLTKFNGQTPDVNDIHKGTWSFILIGPHSVEGWGMPRKIFISYRRDDSAGHAGRVHDRLEREFGRDLLFMDVDAIPLGADFAEKISTEVAKCDVLLAIIGPSWIEARDESGGRRLDNVHDYVRIEIATALKQDTPIIPILLEGTRMLGRSPRIVPC